MSGRVQGVDNHVELLESFRRAVPAEGDPA
jgi:hypothetical protein